MSRRAVANPNHVRKPSGCSEERTGREGERVDRLRTERRPAFDIAGDWKATALEAEVWLETVTEGGRGFTLMCRK